MSDRLLTVEEVAERLTASVRTVYRMARAGEIRCIRVRKVIRFQPADVDAFIDANATRPPVPDVAHVPELVLPRRRRFS